MGRTQGDDVRVNLLLRNVDGVFELVCLDVQPMVPNRSDRPIKISDHRSPQCPLVRVLVRIFPIPEGFQGTQSPREQSDIRKITALVELFVR